MKAGGTLDIVEAIRGRSSVRAFLKKEVAAATVEAILDAARFAPSGANTQPWNVAVVMQDTKTRLSEALLAARKNNLPEHPDYQYYPPEWYEPYKTRRKICGAALYHALGVTKEDSEKRTVVWNNNYTFFGAPVGLIFYLHKTLGTGSWLDCGMFVQNVMLLARGFSLGTCPQASIADYPDVVRGVLGISDDYCILCGMSLGYPEGDHPVNQYRTQRALVSDFTHWFS